MQVLRALIERREHIPYRDSKLTFILQDSLDFAAKTIMFIAASQSDADCDETVCSLQFGARARKAELGAAHINSFLSTSHSNGSGIPTPLDTRNWQEPETAGVNSMLDNVSSLPSKRMGNARSQSSYSGSSTVGRVAPSHSATSSSSVPPNNPSSFRALSRTTAASSARANSSPASVQRSSARSSNQREQHTQPSKSNRQASRTISQASRTASQSNSQSNSRQSSPLVSQYVSQVSSPSRSQTSTPLRGDSPTRAATDEERRADASSSTTDRRGTPVSSSTADMRGTHTSSNTAPHETTRMNIIPAANTDLIAWDPSPSELELGANSTAEAHSFDHQYSRDVQSLPVSLLLLLLLLLL